MTCLSILRASVLAVGLLAAATAQAAAVNASGLLGARVIDAQGERLGDIRDLAVDVAAGSVRYAILEAAETSRLDRKLSAVPLSALRPGLGSDQLVVDTSAGAGWRERLPFAAEGSDVRRLKALVGMTIEHPSGADYGVIDDLVVELDTGRVLHARVSLEAAAGDVKREVPLGALRFPPGEGNAVIAQAETALHTVQAGNLIGMEVRNRQSGGVGKIEDLVVDIGNNRVHYAVLDLPQRMVTQPLQRLEFRGAMEYAVVGAADSRPIEPRSGMALVRASTLLGWEIENVPGVDLGRLTGLLVDPRSGEIPFAAVRLYGTQRLHAVPLDAFAMYVMRENLVFTGERRDLLATPGFTQAQLDRAGAGFVERHAALADELTPGPASAGAMRAAQPGATFLRLDRNHDGFLADAELDRPVAERRNWLAIDLDRDGRISRDEFASMRE